MKILDFGCGSGGFDEISKDRRHTGSWLQSNSFGKELAVGIDHNPERIKEASSKINATFIVADCGHLPYENETFDIVHECGVLHHLKDYKLAINEIARVLKHGGVFLLAEAVDDYPIFALARRIIGKWHGDKIESYFTSNELTADLETFFLLKDVNYYWRFLLSDAILYFGVREPRVSLYFCDIVSKALKKLRLEKKFCSMFVVVMEKR